MSDATNNPKQTSVDMTTTKGRMLSVRSGRMVRVLKLCDQKRDVDDRLGQFSDHEGKKDGPTWHLWSSMSLDKYEEHVGYQIEQHQRAIKTVRELLRLKKAEHPNT